MRARPTVPTKAALTLQGPKAAEKIALSGELAEGAALDVLVASYVSNLNETNPARLVLLTQVADGALGAELVLDLQAPANVPKLSSTTVIVDTPIILSFLDLSSKQEYEAAKVLISQLLESGVKIAAFRHSIEEAEGVLAAIQMARHTGADAYGPSIPRMRNSVYRAYFDSMKNNISSKWTKEFEVIEEAATHFYKNFTAEDEVRLTHEIQRNLYDRLITRERDAKSVAETIRRLGGAHVPNSQISSCKFIFVTGNRPLQSKVSSYLKKNDFVRSGEFTPIVTDRYMAGLCWLILGGKSINSPTVARLLANCAAALRLRPELAERTKKFLTDLDPEKALHFEALMTNERSAQYLMEATFGVTDVLTSHFAEDIFDEAQRRAAVKVGKENDDYYLVQISELQEKISTDAIGVAQLHGELTVSSLEAQARASQAELALAEAERLREDALNKQESIARQASQISKLDSAVQRLTEEAEKSKASLDHHKKTIMLSATKYADDRLLAAKVVGALLLFSACFIVGYFDKFFTPSLSADMQKYGSLAVILMQALLAITGLSILADKWFTAPLNRLRERLYRSRILALGYSDESEVK